MRVILNSRAFQIKLEFAVLVFVEGRKSENPEKFHRVGMRSNNKLNPHVTPGLGMEPRPQWREASALSTAPFMQNVFIIVDFVLVNTTTMIILKISKTKMKFIKCNF